MELAAPTPYGVCSFFFIGLILLVFARVRHTADNIVCARLALEEKALLQKRSNQQNDLSAESIFDVDGPTKSLQRHQFQCTIPL